MENIELAKSEPVFGNIPLANVIPSPTNPRRRFDETYLNELAASIRAHGVASPILVRPHPSVANSVEIVCGECRFRASQIAEQATIPALVRVLNDLQVLEIQVIENLQRKDVHELEEAAGFQRLIDDHGYTVDTLAEKICKSKAYIYARLKLCALTEEVRPAFFDGKLNASTALLIARIPVPSLQIKATEEITKDWRGLPMSYREAVQHIQQRYMLSLDKARFPIQDIKLVKDALPCDACPKLTGNQPILFPDVAANVCTDPDCFAAKTKAHDDREREAAWKEAKKKKVPIYEGDEAREKYEAEDHATLDDWIGNYERPTDDGEMADSIGKAISADLLPKPTAYCVIDGKPEPVYDKTAMQEALERAGLCETIDDYAKRMADMLKSPRSSASGGNSKSDQLRAISEFKEAAAFTEQNVRVAAYMRIREQAKASIASTNALPLEYLRALLKMLTDEYSDYSMPADLMPDLYPAKLDTNEEIHAYIDQAPLDECQCLLMDLIASAGLSVASYDMNNDGTPDVEDENYVDFKMLADAAGVSLDDLRKEYIPAKEEAAPVNFAIGDRVRVKADAKGPSGKKRKCAGREGMIEKISDDSISIRTGEKTGDVIAGLSRDELEPLAQESGETADDADQGTKSKSRKKLLDPAAAWPFPKSATEAAEKQAQKTSNAAKEA